MQYLKKYGIILLVSVVLASCGASVAVDYDKEVTFSEYTSYNFYPDIKSGLNQLDDKRIMRVMDSVLQQKGFIKSEAPQLLVNFYAKETVSNSRNTLGIGVGGGGGAVGVGVSGGIPIGGRVINQALTIDFVAASNDALIWQAIADGELKEKANPKQREAYYEAVVSKVLKEYPPEQESN
ncbi:DUF4136 domain-containing protein [Ulvibacter litoralis]|uniref:DUF4136 domain-containing protein n=1 Tax=Ulvibacter litoralis TaxID=227084 RepID=A0A1G7C035_9FLAO|nr:DUF4136 domain-containing protein [Ulvibacter litoralis]GHC49150.1 hypothetical protein GCM10008083_10780 [Ulvibacter litoralis]SDE32649.1 protein of unknown function [Ulvibacter litoralis]